MREADDQSSTSRRLSVQDAAHQLGVTVDVVRGRIKRGTLESERDEDGTVYVLLETDDQPNGQSQPADDQPQLVEHMQDQLDYLAVSLRCGKKKLGARTTSSQL